MSNPSTTTATATASPPAAPAPLWPQPLPVIGLTGEKWSGKTVCALTIDPKRTLVFDTEKSSLTYQAALGFTRVDVMAEMLKRFPKGHKPVDRFLWWLDQVRGIPAGKYSVIVADTVNEIEGGLADWVEAHPEFFGHTRQQYLKMSGLKWQDVKDYWLTILASEVASKCETFVFITHMGAVWGDNKPTGKRKPKGKETLFQLASLYLEMQRPKDVRGNVQQVPSAIVRKDRVAAFATDPVTGEIKVVPLLPPRLPIATPHAIRQYMLNPPDWSMLKPEEMAPEEATAPLSEDERAEMRLATAEAERDAEQIRLEREQKTRDAEQARRERAAAHTPPPPATVKPATPTPTNAPTNGHGAATQHAPPPPPPPVSPPSQAKSSPTGHDRTASPAPPGSPELATDAQLARLVALRNDLIGLGMPAESWRTILAKRGVDTARKLNVAQADELIAALGNRVATMQLEVGMMGADTGGDAPAASDKSERVADSPSPPAR